MRPREPRRIAAPQRLILPRGSPPSPDQPLVEEESWQQGPGDFTSPLGRALGPIQGPIPPGSDPPIPPIPPGVDPLWLIWGELRAIHAHLDRLVPRGIVVSYTITSGDQLQHLDFNELAFSVTIINDGPNAFEWGIPTQTFGTTKINNGESMVIDADAPVLGSVYYQNFIAGATANARILILL